MGGDQSFSHLEDCLKDVDMPSWVSSHLLHEEVDKDYVRDYHTEETHLLFKYLLLLAPFHGIEAFSVDKVEIADVLEPDSSSAALPDEGCVENWKPRVEDGIEECAFSWGLCAQDRHSETGIRVFF